MNPAITAALIAAHQQSEAPGPLARLKKAKAFNADTAVVLEPSNDAERQQIDAALARGLISRRADGRLFINARAIDEHKARIGYRLLVGILSALSIAASAAALLLFAR